MPGKPRRDVRERFAEYVAPQPDGCHLWTGPSAGGYGVITVADLDGEYLGPIGAHVLAVLLDGRRRACGQIVHHLCATPLCVNPRHLEVLDRRAHAQAHAHDMHTRDPRDLRGLRAPCTPMHTPTATRTPQRENQDRTELVGPPPAA